MSSTIGAHSGQSLSSPPPVLNQPGHFGFQMIGSQTARSSFSQPFNAFNLLNQSQTSYGQFIQTPPTGSAPPDMYSSVGPYRLPIQMPYMSYEPPHNLIPTNYLQPSQLVQQRHGAGNVTPGMQPSNSFFSGSTGAEPASAQQPGRSAAERVTADVSAAALQQRHQRRSFAAEQSAAHQVSDGARTDTKASAPVPAVWPVRHSAAAAETRTAAARTPTAYAAGARQELPVHPTRCAKI
ncbi:unnamed protein product [Nesidiocoris tenuis]|uniref:Uncharacterized protein n=1 Tax=Nesidiocoris tenuis TaxID=355587 RepID=A0A6H5G878_9HEMI|nr:unnamed protein product [Nesidiocoris tenuis]